MRTTGNSDDKAKKQVEKAREEFGVDVRQKRVKRNMSQLGASKEAGMDQSLISRIEKGEKGCGPETASKLCDVFHLTGQERVDFELAAARTCLRTTMPQRIQGYAASLVHAFVKRLAQDELDGIEVDEVIPEYKHKGKDGRVRTYDFAVRLANGKVCLFDMKIVSD